MVASCRKLAVCFAAQPPQNRTHNNGWQQQMNCEVEHLVKQNEDNDKLAARRPLMDDAGQIGCDRSHSRLHEILASRALQRNSCATNRAVTGGYFGAVQPIEQSLAVMPSHRPTTPSK